MIAVKKIVLSLCLILLGASVLSGCTKDEFLDQYNNIVQSAGSIALTGNSSLQGTKEKGIDDYTGSYSQGKNNALSSILCVRIILIIDNKHILLYEHNAFTSHLMLDSDEVYQMTKRGLS